jgi:hypothetical protein
MVLHQADATHDAEQSIIYLNDINATLESLSRPGACKICNYVWSMFTTKMPGLSRNALESSIIRHAISTTPLEYVNIIVFVRIYTRLQF